MPKVNWDKVDAWRPPPKAPERPGAGMNTAITIAVVVFVILMWANAHGGGPDPYQCAQWFC